MESSTNLEASFNLSEKLLLYISKNEPLDSIEELISKSGESEDKIKLNLERVYNHGLIKGHLVKCIGSRYATSVNDLRLTYSGMKEIDQLLKRKDGIKELEVHLGLLSFKI